MKNTNTNNNQKAKMPFDGGAIVECIKQIAFLEAAYFAIKLDDPEDGWQVFNEDEKKAAYKVKNAFQNAFFELIDCYDGGSYFIDTLELRDKTQLTLYSLSLLDGLFHCGNKIIEDDATYWYMNAYANIRDLIPTEMD